MPTLAPGLALPGLPLPGLRPAGLALAAIAATAAVLAPPLAASTGDGRTALPPTSAEARFVMLLNHERLTRGLKPLVWDASLCAAGRQHSQEMARLNYFDHNSPVPGLREPSDRWERFTTARPLSYEIAENLCYSPSATVDRSHRLLMNSTDHRANILNPVFNQVGVGVYVRADGEMWVTEMFLATGGRVPREHLQEVRD